MKKILFVLCLVIGFTGIISKQDNNLLEDTLVIAEEKTSLPENYKAKKISDDVTKNWRVVQAKKPFDPPEHSLLYYEKYFKSDKEIHFIVNKSDKTVTQINSFGVLLDVTVKEYTNNEEKSAKSLGGGDVIKEYHIDTETGEVEQIN